MGNGGVLKKEFAGTVTWAVFEKLCGIGRVLGTVTDYERLQPRGQFALFAGYACLFRRVAKPFEKFSAFLALFAEFAQFLLECLIFFAEGIEFAFGAAGFGTCRFIGLDLLHEFLFGVGEFAFHGFGALSEFVGEVVHFGGFEAFGGGANVLDVVGEDFESFSLRAEIGRNFVNAWG